MAKDISLIHKEIKKIYNELKNKYPIKKVFLYGSYASGRADENSDVDVGFVIDLPEDSDKINITADLFHYTSRVDTAIEPLCILWSEFQNMEPASILADMIRNSVDIA